MVVLRSHLLAAAAIAATSFAGPRCHAGAAEPLSGDAGTLGVSSLQPLSSDLKGVLSGPASTDITPAEASGTDAEILKAPSRLAAAPGTATMAASGSISSNSAIPPAQAGAGLAWGPSAGSSAGCPGDQLSTTASTAAKSNDNLFTASQNSAVSPSSSTPAVPSSFGPCTLPDASVSVSASPEWGLDLNILRPLPAAHLAPQPQGVPRSETTSSTGWPGFGALCVISMSAAFFAVFLPRRRTV